jgi:hypothetical protein
MYNDGMKSSAYEIKGKQSFYRQTGRISQTCMPLSEMEESAF